MKFVVSAAALAACLVASASAETHVAVDVSGNQIVIRAGYYPSELYAPTHYSIDSTGRLLLNGNPDEYVLDQPLTINSTPFYASLDETQLELSSNYYANTGRLDGGDFRYEMTSVVPVPGGGGVVGAVFGIRAAEEGLLALSSAPTRAGRSYDIGLGNLYDDEMMVANQPGVYDVSVVAWDANGKYADSAPLTFHIDVVPEPSSLVLAALPLLALRRRAR